MLLPFTYDCKISCNIYEQSRQYFESSDYGTTLSTYSWAYYTVGDVIPHTEENLWSGHIFPWTESWEDLQVSCNLCLLGYYKQAMISLRGAVELGLLSVYWNIDDQGHHAVQKWLHSQENTPYRKQIWRTLERHKNIALLQQYYDIKAELDELDFLHDFVHAKGNKFSNSMGIRMGNVPSFEPKGVQVWFDALLKVVKVLAILHLAKYPIGVVSYNYSQKFGIDRPAFGGLDKSEIERIRVVIGEAAFSSLEIVAAQDETVKAVLDWISKLPNISGEQVESQVANLDRLLGRQVER